MFQLASKKIKILFISALIFSAEIFLRIKYAAADAICGDASVSVDPATGICTKRAAAVGLLGSTSIADLIFKIINILLGLGGIIAVLYIVLGGYKYITSQGNEKAAESGRNTAVNALIGFILIILAYVIVRIINQTVLWG